MRFLKILAGLYLFGFILSVNALAQPGNTCVLDYNPFEIRELGYIYGNAGLEAVYSSDIFEERINSRHIFIGKIVSQESMKNLRIEGFQDDYFKSLNVNIIKEIAGKLKKKTVDISYRVSCWEIKGIPETGNEYIFFANEINTKSFKGFISSKWSAALDGIPKNELGEITKKIQDYRNGVKQPLVVGYLIKHKPNPYWDYVNHSFSGANLWRSEKFKNDWRIKKWQYDPDYADPLKGVKVTAKNSEGGQFTGREFTTKTDLSGRFEFADLPKGGYGLYPDVPKSYLIGGSCSLNVEGKGGVGFGVYDSRTVCDRTIRLDVAPAGKIEADIHLEQGSWKETSRPDIYLVGANSQTKEIYQNYLMPISIETYRDSDKTLSFANDKVIAGEYVLKVGTALGSDIFYPGVTDIKQAKIFEIKEGETTKLDFSISTLKNRKALR